jgi:hypothetical protein
MKLPQFLMLIPFLKKLMVETSAEAVHKSCKILDENDIPYRLQTFRFQGAIGTGLQSRSYMGFNVTQNKWGATPSFSYGIYVRRKDYQRAQQLTGSIEMG